MKYTIHIMDDLQIGDSILLKYSQEHLPEGAKGIIYGIYPTHFPHIFDTNERVDGMLKISTYGYPRENSTCNQYITYVHKNNAIMLI